LHIWGIYGENLLEIHGNLATQLGQESPELQGLRQEHGFLQEVALDTKEMVEFPRSLNANIFESAF